LAELGLYQTAKVSEDVNRNYTCNAMNTTVQLSTTYTDPERHNAQ